MQSRQTIPSTESSGYGASNPKRLGKALKQNRVEFIPAKTIEKDDFLYSVLAERMNNVLQQSEDGQRIQIDSEQQFPHTRLNSGQKKANSIYVPTATFWCQFKFLRIAGCVGVVRSQTTVLILCTIPDVSSRPNYCRSEV
ncbi:MAG: hypothetical protein ACK52L_23725 [Pirellula sp.]